MKIGIPRALLYYDFGVFWITFIKELGHDVVLSTKTNNTILNSGVKHCVDDACLPIKIFHGHVMDLIDKSDIVFVPRLVSIRKWEFICPKFIGLPEMVKNSLPKVPRLLVVDFNFHKKSKIGYEDLYRVGRQLEATSTVINRAIAASKEALKRYYNKLISGYDPVDLIKNDFKPQSKDLPLVKNQNKLQHKGTIALIGHPYLLFDQYININISKKLKQRNYKVIYPENIEDEHIDKTCSILPKKLFWSYGKKLLGSGLYMLKNQMVDGVIFLSSFGCGIDSFIVELLQRFNRRHYKAPFTVITLDEHSGEAGFDTRLEAFVDMMEWRNGNGYNLSPHGDGLRVSKSTI